MENYRFQKDILVSFEDMKNWRDNPITKTFQEFINDFNEQENKKEPSIHIYEGIQYGSPTNEEIQLRLHLYIGE